LYFYAFCVSAFAHILLTLFFRKKSNMTNQTSAISTQNTVAINTANSINSATLETTKMLSSLVVEHDNWRDNAYKASNEQLYTMLLKCYCLYNSMTGGDEASKEMRKAVNSFASSKGYVFKASTHTITKIVKCVFGVDRRRTSTYSLVLRSALLKGITNFELIDFIRNSGGVEEIRLGSSTKGLSTKDKAKVAANTVAVNSLGIASGTALSQMLDAGKIGENKVFIGAWQADGTVVLRAVIESDTVLAAALAKHYTSIQAAAKAQQKEAEAAAAAEITKQAIQAAAATALVVAATVAA
jgi:hypothetical protein